MAANCIRRQVDLEVKLSCALSKLGLLCAVSLASRFAADIQKQLDKFLTYLIKYCVHRISLPDFPFRWEAGSYLSGLSPLSLCKKIGS